MAKQDISKLKDWFKAGNYPTQEQFWDWMDSYIHKDDRLGIAANFPELDGILQQKAEKEALKYHLENDQNPHSVSKQQVGLGSVDNTADVDKPVSKAIGAALDLKADKSAFDGHVNDQTNPHQVTKAQIGLGNADNTTDLDKPISILTQTALNLKAEKVHTHNANALIGFDTDITLAANSDEKVASQKAVKAYVDEQAKLVKSGVTTAGTTTLPVMKFEQGGLLTTPQNGAWEWDGSDLYFTAKGVRQKIVKGSTFNNGLNMHWVEQIHILSTVDIVKTGGDYTKPAPIRIFNNNREAAKLNILLYIHSSSEVPSSEFSVKTELLLNIGNGLFSQSSSGTNPYTSIKIAEISGNTNVGLKEIELPIIAGSHNPDVQSSQWTSLELFGINNHNGVKSEFLIPNIFIRNAANTRAFGANEATFSLTAKATLTTTKPKATLARPVNYTVTIKNFTLNTIN
jgi:hypothetical protein